MANARGPLGHLRVARANIAKRKERQQTTTCERCVRDVNNCAAPETERRTWQTNGVIRIGCRERVIVNWSVTCYFQHCFAGWMNYRCQLKQLGVSETTSDTDFGFLFFFFPFHFFPYDLGPAWGFSLLKEKHSWLEQLIKSYFSLIVYLKFLKNNYNITFWFIWHN